MEHWEPCSSLCSNDAALYRLDYLLSDNLRGLLRDLPSLPSRHAILLGWASELPVIVRMSALPEEHHPKSDDPDFWAVWSGEGLKTDANGALIERSVDWEQIADHWQQIGTSDVNDGVTTETERLK